MAPKGKGGNFEWLVIRVETIYKILVVVVVLLAGGLGWFFYKRSQGTDIEKEAAECVNKAEAAMDRTKRSMDAQRISQLGPVYNDLAVARDALKNKEWSSVCPAANKVLASLAGFEIATDKPQAVVDDLSGTANVKKSDSPDYVPMNRGMSLATGDIIRTSSSSEVLIRYPDGTKYTIGPDTIYQIRAIIKDAKGYTFSSRLEKGSLAFDRPTSSSRDNTIDIATPRDVTATTTPGVRGAITENPDTKTTDVAIFQGSGSVTHNNQTQDLNAGSQGTIKDNAPIALTELPKQPTLIIPADMQVITTAPDETPNVVFQWSSLTGKYPYQFQIGTDPFLSKDHQLTDQTGLKESTLNLKLPAGSSTYYWRVREVDPKAPAGDGGIGRYIWSYTSAFKVIAQIKHTPGSSSTPVDLTLLCKATQFSGDTFLINCEVTPGITVTVNEQEVDVNEGRCQKMVSFNQPGIHNINIRAFDNYGNEKKQTLQVKVQFI
jgi:hypothetical protein